MAVNFDAAVVVGVFRESVTAGHGVATDDVRIQDGTVRITVILTEPEPGEIYPAVMTFPYELISVSLADVYLPWCATWTMNTTDGEQLAQANYP
jgi:hypothetical protein